MKQKKGVFWRFALQCLIATLLMVWALQPQTARAEIVNLDDLPRSEVDGESTYWKDIIIDENGEPVILSQGVMPSTGEVKIAVIMVDFPDVSGKEAVTQELVEDLFFGEYSLSSYYGHASYGKLNITGDVYGWHTASENRAYYATEANIRTLVNEVLEALEEEIDFTQYDNNNDDYIDGLYICYAGEKGEWATEFWSYVASTAMEVDGKYLDRFAFINENHMYGYDEINEETYTRIYTIAHETGHMLGLKDYYDVANGGYSAIYSGATLMDDSRGELDAFSKYLLGWIDPVVVTQNGSATLQPSFSNASAVIIYPDETVRNENFFMVEYIPGEGSMGYDYTEGIRVYKIDATSEGGYLCHENSLKRDDVDLVDIFSDFNTELGTIIYADKAPSSYFIKKDSAGNAFLEYTGIAIDLVSFNEDEAEISVSYREVDDVEITHTETIRLNNSKLYVELEFSLETLPTENANAYIVIGNEKKNLQISRYDDDVIIMGLLNNDEKVKYVLYSADFELEGNTAYTVVVEEGAFVDPLGNTNEEFSFEVTTEAFPEVTALEDKVLYDAQAGMTIPELNSLYRGEYTPIENNQVIRFYTYLGKLYVEIFDEDGSREVKLLYTPEENANLSYFNSVTMKNGNSILRVKTDEGNSVFLVDRDWNCELLFITQETMVNEIGVVYDKVYLGVYDEKYQIYVEKLYLVTEEGEVTEKELERPYLYQVRAYEILGEEILLVSNDGFDFSIYDKDFNQIKEVIYRHDDYSESAEGMALIRAVERIQEVTVKSGKNVLITCTDGNYQWYELYLDENYNVVQREQLPFDGSGVFANLGDAYLLGQTVNIGKERETPIYLGFGASFMSFSPITKVVITDIEYNEKYNFSIDFLSDSVGDSIENVALTEDGHLFVGTAFGFVTTEDVFEGYTVPELVPEPTLTPDPTANKTITFQNVEVLSATNATYSVDENGKLLALCDGAAGNYEICLELDEPVDTSNYYKIVLECDADLENIGLNWFSISLYSDGQMLKKRSDICADIIYTEDAMLLEIGLKNVADCVIDEIRLGGWSRLTTEYSVNVRNITFVNEAEEELSDTGIYCEPDEDLRVLYCFDEFDLSEYSGKSIIIQFDMKSCGYDLSRPANIAYLGEDNTLGTFDDETIELEKVDVTDEWQTFQITCMVPSDWKDAPVNLALAFWRTSTSGYDNGLCSIYYDNFRITEIVTTDSVGSVDSSITDENITADTIADALNQNAEANNAVLATVVPEVEVTAEDIENAFGGDYAADEAVSVEVRPFLNVAVTELNSESNAMTLDIKAQYEVYAVQGEKEAPIGEIGTLDTAGETITITVPLPSGFVNSINDRVVIKHYKDGMDEPYKYTTEITQDERAIYYATFENPNGFSTFVVETEELAKFAGTSMVLEEAIDLNIWITASQFEGATGLVAKVVKDNGTPEEIPMDEWLVSSSYYKISYKGVAAKEMCDDITITIYDQEGNVVSETKTYTIGYAVAKLYNGSTTTEEYKNLCVAMLKYGAAAQLAFGYKTNDLATKFFTDFVGYEDAQNVMNLSYNAIAELESGETGLATFAGTSMVLEEAIDLNIWITASQFNGATGLVAKVKKGNGAPEEIPMSEWLTSGSYYKISYKGVAAKEMCDDITITIYDQNDSAISETKTYTIGYAVTKLYNGSTTTEEYKNLCIAMLEYGAAAQQAFGYKTEDLATKFFADFGGYVGE